VFALCYNTLAVQPKTAGTVFGVSLSPAEE